MSLGKRWEKWQEAGAGIGRYLLIPASPFALTFVDDPVNKGLPWSAGLTMLFILGLYSDKWLRDSAKNKRKRERDESTRLLQDVSQGAWSFIHSLGSVAVKTPAMRRENEEPLLKELASELRGIMHERHKKIRVTFFVTRTSGDGGKVMKPIFKGRARDRPRDFFEDDGGRGAAAFEYMENGSPLICNDVDKDPPVGWEGTQSDYSAFVSCPISSGEMAYGMLSIDSPAKGTFTEEDRAIVMHYASLAGLALRVVAADK